MQRIYEAFSLNRHAAYQRIVTGMTKWENELTDRQTDWWTPAQMNVLSRRTSRQRQTETDRQRQRHKQQSKVKRSRLAWVIFWPANVYRVSVSGSELSNQLIALFVFTLGFLFVCESLVQLAKALNYICPFTWFAPYMYVYRVFIICYIVWQSSA